MEDGYTTPPQTPLVPPYVGQAPHAPIIHYPVAAPFNNQPFLHFGQPQPAPVININNQPLFLGQAPRRPRGGPNAG